MRTRPRVSTASTVSRYASRMASNSGCVTSPSPTLAFLIGSTDRSIDSRWSKRWMAPVEPP